MGAHRNRWKARKGSEIFWFLGSVVNLSSLFLVICRVCSFLLKKYAYSICTYCRSPEHQREVLIRKGNTYSLQLQIMHLSVVQLALYSSLVLYTTTLFFCSIDLFRLDLLKVRLRIRMAYRGMKTQLLLRKRNSVIRNPNTSHSIVFVYVLHLLNLLFAPGCCLF